MLSFSALAISAGWANCLPDRLTLIVRPSQCGYLACQRCICPQASRSTHSPIGMMRPVSSAQAMNSPGMTRPRVGWFQRSSASKPVIRSLSRSITGW